MEASRYKSIIQRTGLLLVTLMLSGCKFALLDPKGEVGVQVKELIITALLLMLIVVIPVILMTIYFAYKYRAGNTDEEYAPEWSHSTKIELVVWIIPIIIIAILATITWRSTHHLEPSNPLVSDNETLTIEVVSMDWKWLFIYPDHDVATINYVAFPKDVPVKFVLTSDNLMNSFFIPRLGSQLYSMPGMVTRLHLVANQAGDYKGFAASYSGDGFSHMKFIATALPDQQSFDSWIEKVKSAPNTMKDFADYRELAQPSIDDPVTYYSSVPDNLFHQIVMQHPGGMMSDMMDMPSSGDETKHQHGHEHQSHQQMNHEMNHSDQKAGHQMAAHGE
ncbi:Cytochrome bo(3) ubiquinol oxidase subunit 2 precursor [Vibrio aerogenes CECT 7868]|uniref:Ubiquinol oxidase subunit 2 n=1 Tax=Vibrio aerogenes CECT 7868 TaxID=1216006 RepID=A0A1M5VZS3_9VIBR|nr:ubiquinol oxidase subunit II [Vibrio aerogenes]SHH80711.1 Cytochrome bo(3) ubiquinol oxidase subunit 2 precursor [Vibrio aerogenes CECT 7868]